MNKEKFPTKYAVGTLWKTKLLDAFFSNVFLKLGNKIKKNANISRTIFF